MSQYRSVNVSHVLFCFVLGCFFFHAKKIIRKDCKAKSGKKSGFQNSSQKGPNLREGKIILKKATRKYATVLFQTQMLLPR